MIMQKPMGVLDLWLLASAPGFSWLVWLPAVGTAMQVLFGIGPMACTLDLMPWNREGWPRTRDVVEVVLRRPGCERLLSPLFAGGDESVQEA